MPTRVILVQSPLAMRLSEAQFASKFEPTLPHRLYPAYDLNLAHLEGPQRQQVVAQALTELRKLEEGGARGWFPAVEIPQEVQDAAARLQAQADLSAAAKGSLAEGLRTLHARFKDGDAAVAQVREHRINPKTGRPYDAKTVRMELNGLAALGLVLAHSLSEGEPVTHAAIGEGICAA